MGILPRELLGVSAWTHRKFSTRIPGGDGDQNSQLVSKFVYLGAGDTDLLSVSRSASRIQPRVFEIALSID